MDIARTATIPSSAESPVIAHVIDLGPMHWSLVRLRSVAHLRPAENATITNGNAQTRTASRQRCNVKGRTTEGPETRCGGLYNSQSRKTTHLMCTTSFWSHNSGTLPWHNSLFFSARTPTAINCFEAIDHRRWSTAVDGWPLIWL